MMSKTPRALSSLAFKRGLVPSGSHHQSALKERKKRKDLKMKLLALLLILRDVEAVRRHPLTRLQKLTQFSSEMMDKWFLRLPSNSAWKNKFIENANRLKINFQRGNQKCGFYDPQREPHGGLTQEEIEKHAKMVAVREEARKLR